MNRPLLIAHRGDVSAFGENTLEGFASAFEKGADGVEFDIQLIDNQIKVVHGYLYDPATKYPLLEDVLKNFGGRGRLEIEVKSFSTEIIPPLKSALDQYQPSNVEITSSEIPLIPYLSSALEKVSIGVIFQANAYQEWMTEELYVRRLIGHMNLLRAKVVHFGAVPASIITPSLVHSLHQSGLVAHYHIPRGELNQQWELLQSLQDSGVDQCTFDDIALLERRDTQ